MDSNLNANYMVYAIRLDEKEKHEIGGIDFLLRNLPTVLPFILFSVLATVLGLLGKN